jgi:hypothetical protein
MPKSVELCQLVARAISHTMWNVLRNLSTNRRLAHTTDTC